MQHLKQYNGSDDQFRQQYNSYVTSYNTAISSRDHKEVRDSMSKARGSLKDIRGMLDNVPLDGEFIKNEIERITDGDIIHYFRDLYVDRIEEAKKEMQIAIGKYYETTGSTNWKSSTQYKEIKQMFRSGNSLVSECNEVFPDEKFTDLGVFTGSETVKKSGEKKLEMIEAKRYLISMHSPPHTMTQAAPAAPLYDRGETLKRIAEHLRESDDDPSDVFHRELAGHEEPYEIDLIIQRFLHQRQQAAAAPTTPTTPTTPIIRAPFLDGVTTSTGSSSPYDLTFHLLTTTKNPYFFQSQRAFFV